MSLIKVNIKMHDSDPTLRELGVGSDKDFRFEEAYINPDLITSVYPEDENPDYTCINFGGDGVIIDKPMEEFLRLVG